jgi:hypothetical protein
MRRVGGVQKVKILDALKATGEREYLALVHWDREARLILLAWTLYHPAPRARWSEDCPLDWSIKRMIRECWRGVSVDTQKLSVLSGVAPRTIPPKFERLKEARLIYPDGTAEEEALLIIRADMEEAVAAAQKVRRAPITVPGEEVKNDSQGGNAPTRKLIE